MKVRQMKLRTGMYEKESCRCLISITLSEFAWRDGDKAQKPVRIAGRRTVI
jgi:hypothetical protein